MSDTETDKNEESTEEDRTEENRTDENQSNGEETEVSTPDESSEYPLEETPFATIKIISPEPLPIQETSPTPQYEDVDKSASSLLTDEYSSERKEETESEQQNISEATTSRTSIESSYSKIYSKLSPYFIKWSFGFKKNIEVINLTKGKNYEIFYVSSHFGVLYDYKKKVMNFLPGHNYAITSISADATGRWLVTADAGEDTVIIIWDNHLKLPVWSIFNAFPKEGTKVVKISQDARFLAAINWGFEHVLKFWLWTYGKEEADDEVKLDPSYGTARSINFNHVESEQFAVTMDMKVIFFKWIDDEKKLEKCITEIKKHKGKIGLFRETLYLDDNETALTSTALGQIIVWAGFENFDKKYLKTVKIHKAGISSLRMADKIIAISCEDGSILFFDQDLKLLYWVPKSKLDPIVSISFHLTPIRIDPFCDDFEEFQIERDTQFTETETDESFKKIPSDCTLEMKPFPIRDFIFSTATGKMAYICHQKSKIKYLFPKSEAIITSVDCNPNKTHLVTGNECGLIELINYKSKELLLSINLINNTISYLKFSPSGHCLMAGLLRGDILVLDPVLLTIKQKIEQSKAKIMKICFSPNSRFVAYFDSSSAVCLHTENRGEWIFMGKYYSHYKKITDILFEQHPKDQMAPRLFTIGEDRMIVEYDTQNLEIGRLKLVSIDRIEQTAFPKCITTYPNFYPPEKFLMANNEFKLKVIEINSKNCLKTTLGPTTDTPIQFMSVIPDWDKNIKTAKMIYATDKHIGIRKLPPTGNPFEGMGMIAHCEKITNLGISHDYKYIFTIGVNDNAVLMWKLNQSSIDIAHQLGGNDVEPFLPLLEGGPNGFLFKEFENFFYYAQIVHQGEQGNVDRSVNKTLALCEVPDLLRSLGYFPTDYEINNILYELTHLNFEETNSLTEEITFDECLKIYLNHRPAHGYSLESFNKAVLSIADLSDPSDIIIERDELYKTLEERGELMSHQELIGYLNILLLPEDETQPIPTSMPLKKFADDVLGLDLDISEEKVEEITNLK